jgi:PAS domain S-box-containing protein
LEALKEVTNQMIESVSTEIAERKQAEEALQRQSHDLSERVKDLNCLYAISKLVMTPGISFDNLFQEIVNLIPSSWHQAGIACARIVLESQEFRTENFRETVWKQTSDITANGKKVGTLEVCYLEQRPEADEGPFLKEDRKLIDAIAERTGRIIEQKEAEGALRESEEKYRTQFEEALDAIFIADAETGILLDCNQAASVLLGRDKSELVGKHQGILHPPEEIAGKFSKTFKQHVKEKLGQPLEAKVITKNGEIRHVSIKANMLELKGRKVLQGIFRDITDQKRVETEKKKLEDHLQRAEKMEVVGTLAGGVAHDLNNILGGLVSYPDLLLMELSEDSPLRKPILTIQESGQKAAAIVQDMLTLARRGVAVSEVVNLNDIIREYLASPEHERLNSFHPRVQIETRLERDLLNTLASPVHLSKTIMNLVSNAAEALPDGGKVSISTTNQYIDRPIRAYDEVKEGDYVILSVADNGLGISSQDIQRIFEPFYTKKVMGRSGTGLGMAVVWGTVKDHKGYIEIKSTEGKGTRFDLYFPATRKEAEKEKGAASIEEYMGRGESILVIDDVLEQREIASVLLTQLGYSAHSVSSGEEAVVYMKSNSADLLVLDMIMDPGIDGLDTYKEILELHPGTKAIIASGFSETDRVREAQRLGAGQYIKKPYTLEKIGLAVKAELGK